MGAYGLEPPSAVIVPVKIGQEAEAGRGAGFEERQGLWEAREDRQQHRAAPGFVGLRRAHQHQRVERVFPLRDTAAKPVPVGWCADQGARGGEQQIGLAFRTRQGQQEIEDFVICGDAASELFVKR